MTHWAALRPSVQKIDVVHGGATSPNHFDLSQISMLCDDAPHRLCLIRRELAGEVVQRYSGVIT